MSTRSYRQPMSRRQAALFTKACRAKAHKDGTTFRETLDELDAYQVGTRSCPCCVRHSRPNYGRSFVSHVKDDLRVGALDVNDEDVYDFKIDFPVQEAPKRNTDRTVDLMDIARPGRRKGPAKHFEVIPKLRQVIALDDGSEFEFEAFDDFVELEDLEDWSLSDEEWEAIFADEQTERKKS